jgi:DNA-binding XRE family transcriptional regulator
MKKTLPPPDFQAAFQERLARLIAHLNSVLQNDPTLLLAVPDEDEPDLHERWIEQILKEREHLPHLRQTWLSTRTPPAGITLPLSIQQSLTIAEQGIVEDARFMFNQVSACQLVVDRKLLAATLVRSEVIDLWPRPTAMQSAGAFALHGLTAICRDLPGKELRPDRNFLSSTDAQQITNIYWPLDAAPLEVAKWARKPLNLVRMGLGDEFLVQIEQGIAPTNLSLPLGDKEIFIQPGCLAAFFLAEKDVRIGMDRKFIAVDAGKHHNDMVGGWRDIKQDGRRHHCAPSDLPVKLEDQIERIELLAPGTSTQLQLPISELETAHDSAINALRRLRGPEGLRHWAALLKLFSVEGGRRGTYRWLLDEHLEALGYDERQRRDPEVRAQAVRMVEFLVSLELAIYTPGGALRERRRLLLETGRFERLQGSEWKIEGLEFQMNERVYGGVRASTGEIGQNWMPAPIELAKIDHVRFPHAHGLGMLLAIRFRWRLNEDADFILISGENLLKLSGIFYDSHRITRTWDKLRHTLDELVRVGQLQSYQWQLPGDPWSLDGMCRIQSANWLTDRVGRAIHGDEKPPDADRPVTGAELKVWREKRGLSQREAAKRLKIGHAAISKAEARPSDPLGYKLKEVFLGESLRKATKSDS